MKFLYYPGCSMEGTARPYGETIPAAAAALGLNLLPMTGWTCCGASSAHALAPAQARELARLPLTNGPRPLPVLTACAACYHNLIFAFHSAADETLSRPEHMLFQAAASGAIAALKKAVTVNIPLRIAPYYGCLLTKPGSLTGHPDPEAPRELQTILTAVGAAPVEWSFSTDCCGAAQALLRPETGERLTGRLLAMAQAAGAEALVTACPMCQQNLETVQFRRQESALPVFYFTELICLAIGASSANAALAKHLIDPRPLLRLRGVSI